MIKALLVCMQGMSTAMMEKKIITSALERDIAIQIKAIAVNSFKSAGDLDIIILGPQLKYAMKDFQKKLDAEGKQIPIYVIEPKDFGMMRGDIVLTKIMEVLHK